MLDGCIRTSGYSSIWALMPRRISSISNFI